ncbi:unnamed protein product [Ambrosiozyma monospora]|uniref:Unnamed protein product n=1 Tax=Ambrosiozyma monospora TaxID=43982 RepID=A0A9W6T762_AMBMO|nr:unnamed protein product [Ambrosiozyma monospora]
MKLKNFEPRYDPQTELETRTEFWMNNSTLHSEFKPFKFDLQDMDDINIRAATIIANESLIVKSYPITDTGNPVAKPTPYISVNWIYNAYVLQSFSSLRYYRSMKVSGILKQKVITRKRIYERIQQENEKKAAISKGDNHHAYDSSVDSIDLRPVNNDNTRTYTTWKEPKKKEPVMFIASNWFRRKIMLSISTHT